MTTPLFKGDFRNDVSPPTIRLTDETDYSGFNPMVDTSRGIYKITGPNGAVFYQNTGWDSNDFTDYDSFNYPTTDPDYNPVFSTNLPVDSSGLILQGDYFIEYKIQDVVQSIQPYIYNSATFNYCHIIPTVSIEQVVECFNSLITSNDLTNYNSPVGNYVLTLDRIHILYYPVALSKTPVTVTGAQIQVSPIYTNTWTTTISTIATYTFTTGDFTYTYIDLLEGSKEINVVCDTNLCSISCGIERLNTRYLNSVRYSSQKEQDAIFYKLTRCVQLMQLFLNAQACGLNDEANGYLQEIFTVGEFTSGCNCDGDDPQLIIPSGGGPAAVDVTVSAGVGILVTSTTNQGVTNYVVQLSSAYQDKIDNLKNVTFTTNTPTVVTFSSSTTGYLTTWTIDVGVPALGPDAVATSNIQNLAVTTAKINDLAVTTGKINDLAVTTGKINDLAVTTAKINDLAVTTGKLDDVSVTNAKLALLSVATGNLQDVSVTNAKLGLLSVATGNLQDVSVTNAKLGLLSVATGNLQDLSVTAAKIVSATITQTQMASNSIGGAQIQGLAVSSNKLADGAVVEDKIATGAVTTTKIGAAAVTTAKIANNAITWPLLDTTLQSIQNIYGVSFETAGIGTTGYTVPTNQSMNIQKISAVVTNTIAGGNNATITVIDSIGAITITTITIPLGSPVGTVVTAAGPFAPIITPSGSIQFTTAKATPGGSCDVIIEYYPV